MTGNPDQHLINECLAGRTAAFDQLVFRYQDRLYNSLVRMLRSAEDARDIAQEAWVHAFQGLTTFRGNSAFYSWLFRIAYNAAVSDKRKLRVTGASLEAAREQAGVEPADHRAESEPSHALVQTERQARVQTALAHLSEEYRTVLVLKELENLKYEEIAELTGCPIGTVRSRIHRARLELADKLRQLFPNGEF
ncbi:MAG: sigma-70 family RNA polymerase sigma factor [Planctomycetaceae bacterium]|nr:sigma-70 family RNA polymerase sigma factor [Planctomycetaceae bacterium]